MSGEDQEIGGLGTDSAKPVAGELRHEEDKRQGSGKGIDLWQRVLSETVADKVGGSPWSIGGQLSEELMKLKWTGIEHRDDPNLPAINFLVPEATEKSEDLTSVVAKVLERARLLVDLFGYQKEDLKSLNVLIDPVEIRYDNAKALYQVKERNLFIKKAKNGLGVDHELVHWITLGLFDYGQEPESLLLWEGIAGYVSWRIKTAEERSAFPIEDYWEGATFFAVNSLRDNLSLDMDYLDVPSRCFGGMLFEVLNEEFERQEKGTGMRKIAQFWRTANRYPKVSAWIESMGLSAGEIEGKWKDKIIAQKEAAS